MRARPSRPETRQHRARGRGAGRRAACRKPFSEAVAAQDVERELHVGGEEAPAARVERIVARVVHHARRRGPENVEERELAADLVRGSTMLKVSVCW